MLVVGIIVDTLQGAVARLFNDLAALLLLEPALAPLEVVLLENPVEAPLQATEPEGLRKLATQTGLIVHWKSRLEQRSDAARGLFGDLALSLGRQPIATARTMLQRYVSQYCQRDPSAVAWILDEDLRLKPMLQRLRTGDYSLLDTISSLRQRRVDVAIAPILGAPPLPSQSSIRVNLRDVLRHLERLEQLSPHAAWPDLSAANALARARLNDYYYDFSHAHEDAAETPFWLEPRQPNETALEILERLASGLTELVAGQPLTRGLSPGPVPLHLQPSVARGGNTLLLTPELLAEIPNLAPRIEGRVTRRSDMIWARLACLLKGAQLVQADVPVEQDRTGRGCSPFEASKLLDDVRGSAVIAAFDEALRLGAWGRSPDLRLCPSAEGMSQALSRYESHRAHRLRLIQSSEDEVRQLLLTLQQKVDEWQRHCPWALAATHLQTICTQLRSGLNTLTTAYELLEPVRWQVLAPLKCPSDELAAVSRFLTGLLPAVEDYRQASSG